MKLIHITDLHMNWLSDTLYGANPGERLEKMVEDINAHHADADFCVATGDLAHQGAPEDYEILYRIIKKLIPPIALLVGNHDDRQALRNRFPDGYYDENGFVQGVQRLGDTSLVFLDSKANDDHWDYCEKRLSWLGRTLAQTPGDLLLFMHHPPFSVGLPGMDAPLSSNIQTFQDTLRPHVPRIRHLFLGHMHRPISGSWMAIPYSVLQGASFQVGLRFSTDEPFCVTQEPPAYGVALIGAKQVCVHLNAFLDSSPRILL